MKLSSDEIVKILNVVIGTTQACGMHRMDKDVLENVQILAEVTDTLVGWLMLSAETFDSSAMSEREVGEAAMFALTGIKDWLEEWINENKLS